MQAAGGVPVFVLCVFQNEKHAHPSVMSQGAVNLFSAAIPSEYEM